MCVCTCNSFSMLLLLPCWRDSQHRFCEGNSRFLGGTRALINVQCGVEHLSHSFSIGAQWQHLCTCNEFYFYSTVTLLFLSSSNVSCCNYCSCCTVIAMWTVMLQLPCFQIKHHYDFKLFRLWNSKHSVRDKKQSKNMDLNLSDKLVFMDITLECCQS